MIQNTYHVISPITEVREKPDATAARGKLESQLVFGETFIAESINGEWVKGACGHDGYTGFVAKKDLTPTQQPATHVVHDIRAHIYQSNSIKSPLLRTLGFGSRITITGQDEKFFQLADGGYIYAKHLQPVSAQIKDYTATALKFLETPYQWGGRSGFGIDCSGLVQVVLAHAGLNAPRDTEQQISTIGRDIAGQSLQRGDIIFFPGHVGIMLDEKNIIHANAHHMKVTCEPLAAMQERSGGITGQRRLDFLFCSTGKTGRNFSSWLPGIK